MNKNNHTPLPQEVSTSQRQNAQLLLLDFALLLCNALAFTVCWFAYYEKHLYLSFEGNGNYMVIGLFFALNAVFSNVYGGFDLLTSRITELVYSHIIALVMTHFFMYMVAWLLVRNAVPTPVPLFLCFVACCLISALWAYVSYQLTDRIVPPKRTLLIYDNPEAHKNGVKIAQKYTSRFLVVGEAIATRPTPEIFQQIDTARAEAVLLCGLRSSLRNDILKYCVEHDILAYVRPNIGDLLLSNAHTFQQLRMVLLALCQASAGGL